jgi:hypothetical protein
MEQVDFESLNAKQIAKVFKETGKEVKSKDPEVRVKVLHKLQNDGRYFIDGNCMPIFLNTITTKKVINYSIFIMNISNHITAFLKNIFHFRTFPEIF